MEAPVVGSIVPSTANELEISGGEDWGTSPFALRPPAAASSRLRRLRRLTVDSHAKDRRWRISVGGRTTTMKVKAKINAGQDTFTSEHAQR
jgi:hypothetical protein